MADVLPSDELIEEPSDHGALAPGTRLGRYELLVPIARGGMARVWAARLHAQRGFQKLVAIKTILPHLASEPEFERMFLDEARIASGVHHPNVCEIYELGEDGKTLYLAMEWVSGDSFSRLLRASGRAEAIDARVVARVLADSCAGLHAAHELTDDLGRELGVVHRDLSPHNILLSADGIAKVADFGVAKALGQLHEQTSAGQLKGKIHYMSPEQVMGSPIDRRSDVFSLGCVLYEATTGVRPFQGDGDHQVMHQLLKGDFAPPSAIVRGYPLELERIVQCALAPQPAQRFPTAERMRFALEEFLARGPLVTQSNVAQVQRQRIGEDLDRRKERIRQASTAGEREGWNEPLGASRTPTGHASHRSGVKAANHHPLMQMAGGAEAGPPSTRGGSVGVGVGAAGGAPPQPESERARALPPAMGMTGGFDESAPASSRQPATIAMQSPAMGLPPTVPHPFSPQPPPVGTPYAGGMTLTNMQPLTLPEHAGPTSYPHHGPGSGQGVSAYGPMGGPANGAPSTRGMYGPAAGSSASAAQYAIAVGVGVLVAIVIGVGGYFAWRAKTSPAGVPSTAPSSVDSRASSTSAASADVVLDVVPAEASLSVDGAPLAPGVRKLPRPLPGRVVTLSARASGYEDATVLVDAFSKSPLRVSLAKASAPPPVVPALQEPSAQTPSTPSSPPTPRAVTPAPPAPAVPEPQGAPAETPKPRPRPKGPAPSLPDNPY